jgi:hypothetical protein
MLFDLGGTAKRRNFAHVRGRRRRVHRTLAFGVSKVYRLVHDLQTSHFCFGLLVELRVRVPQNERARAPLVCKTLPRQAPDWAYRVESTRSKQT